MKNGFDITDEHGNHVGRLQPRGSGILLPILILFAAVGAGALTYFIWPLIYDLFLKQLETGKTEYIITMSTTIVGVLLGCVGALIYTLRMCMKDGPKSVGMAATVMVGVKAAAIGGFATSFGTTAIAFVVLGITTGTFNVGEFLLLLLMSAVVSGLLCIVPALITSLLSGFIVFFYDVFGRKK